MTTLHNWRGCLWGRHFTASTDYAALRYMYSMQGTSTMLKRWAVSLQAHDFSVKHRPRKPNVIPGMLPRVLEFEQSERVYTPTTLSLMSRKILGNPSLLTRAPQNTHQLEMDNMADLTPAMGDRDTSETIVHVRATNVLTTRTPPNSEKPSVRNSNHTSSTLQAAPHPYFWGKLSQACHTPSSTSTNSPDPTPRDTRESEVRYATWSWCRKPPSS